MTVVEEEKAEREGRLFELNLAAGEIITEMIDASDVNSLMQAIASFQMAVEAAWLGLQELGASRETIDAVRNGYADTVRDQLKDNHLEEC